MATYGHSGGGWMNSDQRGAMKDKALAKMPTKPGFYWALWLTAAPNTPEGDELTPAQEWEVVEVWENFIGEPCEADRCEKWGVSVTGVSTAQWLKNFQWGDGPLVRVG
jgi:hypothetical protein